MKATEKAIEVSGLSRHFTTHLKAPGFAGAVRGLFKREYKTKVAVDSVSFAIERGEFVGFLGPNGAGKTTTLKMLAGVLHPTSGTAQVLGFTPWERSPEFQRRFSLVLGQKNQLWWDLPAYDSFELNRDIYEIEPRAFDAKVAEMSELLDLKDLLRVPVRKLSLGERMKCEVVASLLHSPEVLFLDEPTIGLDVVSQVRIREFLRDYNARTGITVILTSHYMADIQALCERVVVIDGGRVMFDGALAKLSAMGGDKRSLKLTLEHELSAQDLEALRRVSPEIELSGLTISMRVPSGEVPNTVTQALQVLAGAGVRDLSVEEADIEAVFRDLFSRSAEEKAVPLSVD
jgi:ABC-2 type transport system ATP-binding protein